MGHAESTTCKAEVIAVGEDCEKVSVGDLILLTIGAGDAVDYAGDMYVIVDEIAVLAVLDRN